ncbi:hypothetical protein SD77_2723 [Bacillus badius]|uniref:Ribose 5-phosphate isomerase B n=1 Tax=Bacillus badius TaxID=1455 RepID=A0ABR5APW3_BACBA|nr:hypothetical protein SD78_4407 [Bacillus badius]KIL75883.1 hypothetical protein SD77_2723 [Bacillus badius]
MRRGSFLQQTSVKGASSFLVRLAGARPCAKKAGIKSKSEAYALNEEV